MRRIGFTGTQEGMTSHQLMALMAILRREDELHHGDCVGADAQAHRVAESGTLIRIVIHPPTNSSKRAFCHGNKNVNVYEPKEYLDRNHDIVDSTDFLIAAPYEMDEQRRSGTWATIRYARKQCKPIIILDPGYVRSEVDLANTDPFSD